MEHRDPLEKLINDKTTERDAVRQEVDLKKAAFDEAKRKLDDAQSSLRDIELELKAYQKAAVLRPVAPSPHVAAILRVVSGDGTAPRRGGRQPGSITKKWREALADLVSAGNQPIEFQQFYLLTRARLGLAEASIRERVRMYVTQGHLEDIDGRIRVSQSAIDRFALLRPLDDEAVADLIDDAEDHNAAAPH